MPSLLKKISKLIPYLPVKDIPFANKFYEAKDWESLKELTWSSLERIENALKKEVLPTKYVGIDIDKVRELAVCCSEYYYIIFPEELEADEEDYNDDCGEDF